MKRSWIVAAAVVMLVHVRLGCTAEVGPVPTGTRVRVLSAGGNGFSGTAQGTLIRLGPDVLGVVDEGRGAVVAVPESAIVRVQTSPGPKRHARTGLILGAVFGAAVMYVFVNDPSVGCSLDPTVYRPCTGGERAAWAAFGGALYGGVGALVGHFVKTEKWTDTHVDRLKVALRVERGGGRASVAFSF